MAWPPSPPAHHSVGGVLPLSEVSRCKSADDWIKSGLHSQQCPACRNFHKAHINYRHLHICSFQDLLFSRGPGEYSSSPREKVVSISLPEGVKYVVTIYEFAFFQGNSFVVVDDQTLLPPEFINNVNSFKISEGE